MTNQPIIVDDTLLKPIRCYEQYFVSKDGRVWSQRRKRGRWMAQTKHSCGYLSVGLRDSSGRVYRKYIHRLVAEAWIPNPKHFSQVNHKDENKLNNDVSNLEWCTPSYNSNYGTRNKRISKPVINLTTKTVYPSITAAAKAYGLQTSSITEVCKGKQFRTHGFRWAYYKGDDDLSLSQY